MKIMTYIALGCGMIITGLFLISLWGAANAERDYPPTGKFIKIDDLNIHYIDQGSGTAIVFCHGASTSLLDFTSSLMPALAKQHRVIALDRPGYGYSDRPQDQWPDPAFQAELLYKLLKKLNIHKPVLIGHSWSGSVILAYLLAYDDAAAGILLAGGTHPWQGGVATSNHIPGIPLLGSIFASTLVYPAGQLLLKDAVTEVFAPEAVPENYIKRTGLALTLRPATFKATSEDVRKLSDYLAEQSKHYEKIHSPLLLITGDSDTIVPAWNHSDRLIQQVTHAKKIVLPGAGHAFHHTQTEHISKLILNFTNQVTETSVGQNR